MIWKTKTKWTQTILAETLIRHAFNYVQYFFLDIIPRSNQIRKYLNYGSNKSVWKLLELDKNTWYDMIMCK